MQSSKAPQNEGQCRNKAAKVKARLLNIDRLCFPLMLLSASLSAVIDAGFWSWFLFVITLALFALGITVGKRVHKID